MWTKLSKKDYVIKWLLFLEIQFLVNTGTLASFKSTETKKPLNGYFCLSNPLIFFFEINGVQAMDDIQHMLTHYQTTKF